jgi:hypothetical protein
MRQKKNENIYRRTAAVAVSIADSPLPNPTNPQPPMRCCRLGFEALKTMLNNLRLVVQQRIRGALPPKPQDDFP